MFKMFWAINKSLKNKVHFTLYFTVKIQLTFLNRILFYKHTWTGLVIVGIGFGLFKSVALLAANEISWFRLLTTALLLFNWLHEVSSELLKLGPGSSLKTWMRDALGRIFFFGLRPFWADSDESEDIVQLFLVGLIFN